jgi:hypothetical protein
MFVRVRKTKRKIQFTIVETRRVAGKVKHEHIGSLGSIATPIMVTGRIAFWQVLHERLARLGNRIDTEAQGKILASIHAQVPMVTSDEQRALQVENAEADERLWSWLREAHADDVTDGASITCSTDCCYQPASLISASAIGSRERCSGAPTKWI